VRVMTENVCVWLVEEKATRRLGGRGGEGSDWEGGPGKGDHIPVYCWGLSPSSELSILKLRATEFVRSTDAAFCLR
jgi:hypothetical protein